MTTSFREQGGAATMDPGPLRRWVTSRLLTALCAPQRLSKRRRRSERRRRRAGAPHVVEYFHQIDDGYSQLAAQVLPALQERYDIQLRCHLVSGPQGRNAAEPRLLSQLSRYDAFQVAPAYGLRFPQCSDAVAPDLATLAERILAAQDDNGFVRNCATVGAALWSADQAALRHLAREYGCASGSSADVRRAAGTRRREQLGHYSGAMFCYGGEWYWGVDRLYHLEQRLAELGLDRAPGEPLLTPRPAMAAPSLRDDGSLTLEIYPSLRSPYTAICFDRAVALAHATGVTLSVRPVLPMVMRGVPATREKGLYIFWDAAREARAAGVPFGRFYDPIGNPARHGYALYWWAQEQGRGVQLISAFLRCAFAAGINTNTRRGLRTVVELAGLDWARAKTVLGNTGHEPALEANRLSMYAAGLWGVPSFRLLDEHGEEVLALWGQDRLWLLAREIQRQLAARGEAQNRLG